MSVLASGTFECADIGAVVPGRGPDEAQAVCAFRTRRPLDRQERRSDSIGLPVGHSATRGLGGSASGVLITDKSQRSGCDEVHNAIKPRKFLFRRCFFSKSTTSAVERKVKARFSEPGFSFACMLTDRPEAWTALRSLEASNRRLRNLRIDERNRNQCCFVSFDDGAFIGG
jgi:hypothetical protein